METMIVMARGKSRGNELEERKTININNIFDDED